MSGDSEQEGREETQQTDFDSLFILNEEDKADLVAKQQQISYIRRGEGGSGAGSPARGSPARRTQVSPDLCLTSVTDTRCCRAEAPANIRPGSPMCWGPG